MSDAGKVKLWAVLLGMLWLLPAAACAQGMMGDRGMMGGGMMNGGMMNGASPRQVYFMRHGLPEQYAKMANPLPASAKNIDAGKALYGQACAACHGEVCKQDALAREVKLSMMFCVGCHKARKATVKCNACHTLSM